MLDRVYESNIITLLNFSKSELSASIQELFSNTEDKAYKEQTE